MILCIQSHFSSSSSQISHLPATANAPGVAGATLSQVTARSSTINIDNTHVQPDTSASFFTPRRRNTGMIVYDASEKDCIGADGEGLQECVICFEEFAVGDEMGRLECLCKFHKVIYLIFARPSWRIGSHDGCSVAYCNGGTPKAQELVPFIKEVFDLMVILGNPLIGPGGLSRCS